MSTDVTVLRVFTDADGNFGNPLGVVDAERVPAAERQRLATQLGYSESIFVDVPVTGSTTARAVIHTPGTELPFAGHPSIGASWWLRARGLPIATLQVPAGLVQVTYAGDLTMISARADWSPEFAIHDFGSPDAVTAADPADFPSGIAHYLWAWTDEASGAVRARMFASNLGVEEDEATGSAAIRLTEYLRRNLVIVQGKGSVLETGWSPGGWITVAGRVTEDVVRQAD